jgi:hypothetical protein
MSSSKLRRQIAFDAARLMYDRQESEYDRAKLKAARRLGQGWVKPADLPSNAEIRDEIQQLARVYEGDSRLDQLRQMRVAALRLMTLLQRFRPRLIGSVLTGHTRAGSDIDLHVFSNSLESVTAELEYHGITYSTERKQVRKGGIPETFRHIHVSDRFEFELTVYPENKSGHVFKSSITGKPMERASLGELRQFLEQEYPDLDCARAVEDESEQVDRFQMYYALLLPLESVRQDPRFHPEGDALYHSLQVFDRAVDRLPYDEEFLLAALLHDVGKGLDPENHVAAALEALEGLITHRTAWLIQHHMDGHRVRERSIGARALRRLRENESFDELLLLAECDRMGRRQGQPTSTLEDALQYVRDLANMG